VAVVEDDDTGWASIIALDPGGTTGWCVMTVHPEALVADDVRILDNIQHFSYGQFYGAEIDQELEILKLLEAWPGSPGVLERFVLRKFLKSAELLAPVRVNAVVEFIMATGYVGRFQPRPYVLQQPSDAKSTATDDRLKEWGLYRPDGQEHARDATRHAITLLRRAKGQVGKKLLTHLWPSLYERGAPYDVKEAGPDA
jgi:hypothetical protein